MYQRQGQQCVQRDLHKSRKLDILVRPASELVLSLLAPMIVAIVLIARNGHIVGEVDTTAYSDDVESSDSVANLMLAMLTIWLFLGTMTSMSGGAMVE